ncbi:GPI-anchored protein LLG1 [Andrographis paniculata]|uniref:GPI-anchored protein LLG1 n=1 Tax=Andrographis paniculata TaxID=175694 RepID=UPI0021E71D86|nr:GPI-anchored protein LLG1 [Andrographis paniculata]
MDLRLRLIIKPCLLLVFLFALFTSLSSASTFISDGVFGSSVLSERRLLQAKKPCPVNFEFQNYTIITSKCKGPSYLPKLCCPPFKDFACPFAEYVNDLSTDCASTMFSYINLYGKYPPGLFSSLCKEGKEGLLCPALPPGSSVPSRKSLVNSASPVIPLMALTVASLVFSLQFV